MIYCFSGTGNSLSIACRLADLLDERVSMMFKAEASDDASIGIVFPVYGWGVPRTVKDFLLAHRQMFTGKYLYAVMTCGDDIGYTDHVVEKLIGRKLNAAYSLAMPNTYVCLPGFDIDPVELAEHKKQTSSSALPDIAGGIMKGIDDRRVERGLFPWTKTYVLRPLFDRFLVTDRFFRVDTSKCVSCGKCKRACPVENIAMSSSVYPLWKGNCVGCLACYHVCPQHAVNYGRMTINKGQKK